MFRDYRSLKVWSKSLDITQAIYIFCKQFPEDERYGLSSQLRRAVISISSNIAEGCAGTETEFKRFLRIALRSAFETQSQLILANRLGFIDSNRFNKVNEELIILMKMINKLYHNLPHPKD